jgi:hypothetical protein
MANASAAADRVLPVYPDIACKVALVTGVAPLHHDEDRRFAGPANQTWPKQGVSSPFSKNIPVTLVANRE